MARLPTGVLVWTGVLLVAPELPALEVPFSAELPVDGALDGARSVVAADLDGDGDLDVLGAAAAGDVTWRMNVAGDGSVWSGAVVDGDFTGARSVVAADIDGDGDLDALGAAYDAGIAWWQNAQGDGSAWSRQAIDTAFAGAYSVLAAERWPLPWSAGRRAPLRTAARALVESLRVYVDADDTGDYGLGDSLVTAVDTLALDAGGRQTVAFADGSADVRVALGTPRIYFVVVELTADAASRSPNQLRVTHVTAASSTAEDAEHDIPLVLEFSANVSSKTVLASKTWVLTVSIAGTGQGVVTSAPTGIDCGSLCGASFFDATPVTLAAEAAFCSTFVGWSGDADCSDGAVIMDADRSCTATFDLTLPDELLLHDMVVSTVEVYEACHSIVATEFEVVATGDVVLRAGDWVALGEGFALHDGSNFRIEIQP